MGLINTFRYKGYDIHFTFNTHKPNVYMLDAKKEFTNIKDIKRYIDKVLLREKKLERLKEI